jgi:hypothetical protein
MIGNFKREHMRRYVRSRAWARPRSFAKGDEPVGAGSGGDPPVDGSQTIYFQGLWGVGAGMIKLAAEDHSDSGISFNSSDPVASLAAISHDGAKGRVVLLGTQGVRIASKVGADPSSDNPSINGVEIYVQDTKQIKFQQGKYGTQMMTMINAGTTISGTTEVLIQCDQQITLQVGGGVSSITLTPTGIVMKGPLIQIN